MKMLRYAILFGTLAFFLYFVNMGIINSERNITEGTVAYFDLAPRDPRSLIQGDYMVLRYTLEADATGSDNVLGQRGQFVLMLDENQVAHFDRVYTDGEPLNENEILVNYTSTNRWNVDVGVDTFLFQEGQADDYAQARFAEVRILDGGGVMLIDLTDENRVPIVPSN